jgi:hypothetical protein
MEACRQLEFTGIELAGGAELAAPVEKAAAGPMEKASVGPYVGEARGGREAWWRGRRAVVLWRGGDVGRRWRGKRIGERRHQGGAVERGHRELS